MRKGGGRVVKQEIKGFFILPLGKLIRFKNAF